MVEIRHKLSLVGPTDNGRIKRRPQDAFGLLTCVVLTNVAQELQEPNIPQEGKTEPAIPDSPGFSGKIATS